MLFFMHQLIESIQYHAYAKYLWGVAIVSQVGLQMEVRLGDGIKISPFKYYEKSSVGLLSYRSIFYWTGG